MFIDIWPAKPKQLSSYDGSFASVLQASIGPAGQSVTPASAMRTAAVYACVRVLAETLAQLPIHVYQRQRDGSKRLASEHPLNYVLQVEPNQWQTGYEFREMMMGHLALRGNAYAEIVPGTRGAATELLPWHPDCVRVERLTNGRLRYMVRQTNGGELPYAQDEVFHLRGLSLDGICGMSPISLLRDPIALAKAAEVYGATFFANSARPDGLLTTDADLKAEAATKLRENWQKAHGGAGSNGTAVLSNGLKWQNIGMTNTDAQFLELRKMEVTEIARGFRVPPHMIADLTQSTNNNIEHQGLEFVKYCMAPWLARWEQRINLDLIADERYYCKFNFDGLQRGDAASRLAFYQGMVNAGIMSINEARELEDMNPIEGGDEHLVQGAMITLDRAINPPEPPAPKPFFGSEEKKQADDEADEMRATIAAQALRLGEQAGTLGILQSDAEAKQLKILELTHAKEHGEADLAAGKAREAALKNEVEARLAELLSLQSKLSEECRAHAEYAEQMGQKFATMQGDLDRGNVLNGELQGQIVVALGSAECLAASAAERMHRWELTKLRKLSRTPKGFLAAVDEFYEAASQTVPDAIGEPLALVCLLSGKEQSIDVAARCEAYLASHREQIVELSGLATPDNLAELVEQCVSGWKNDINSILESDNHEDS